VVQAAARGDSGIGARHVSSTAAANGRAASRQFIEQRVAQEITFQTDSRRDRSSHGASVYSKLHPQGKVFQRLPRLFSVGTRISVAETTNWIRPYIAQGLLSGAGSTRSGREPRGWRASSGQDVDYGSYRIGAVQHRCGSCKDAGDFTEFILTKRPRAEIVPGVAMGGTSRA